MNINEFDYYLIGRDGKFASPLLMNDDKEIDETIISIKLNKKDKSMLFYYGNECEGETFFEFGIGKVLTRCVSLIKENDLIYTQELSDWFTDAISGIPEHIYEDLELTIEVPETDGDPYL